MDHNELLKKLRRVNLILTDFDGVWTDGKVYVSSGGIESVVCSRKDTLRVPEIKALGIRIIVVSREVNSVVSRRCEKMGIECAQGIADKGYYVRRMMGEMYPAETTAFVGDDINDREAMKLVGVRLTVADAHLSVIAIADYVTKRRGGDHAMREIFDLFLEAHEAEEGR